VKETQELRCLVAMSETLPPITGAGVMLQFTFPFDRAMPRKASIVWRRQIGGRAADTWYADVVQSGEQEVVHEQVTFPGDAWAVCSKEDGALLVLHVATGEREQRVHICPEARAAAETAQAVAPAVEIPASTVDDGDDPELAAAIAASLAVAKPSCSSDRLSEALSLSQRLCTAWRAMARLQQASAGTSAAGAAGGGGGPSVRLQIVLPGGERSFHEVDGSATLAGVTALAALLLAERHGLGWLADLVDDRRQATHALSCLTPRLRLDFHAGGSPRAGDGASAVTTVAAAGLAPSATLRIVALSAGAE